MVKHSALTVNFKRFKVRKIRTGRGEIKWNPVNFNDTDVSNKIR